ncbi:MAG: hypothetical protein ABI298_08810 [Acidimicrobiales bacterium]
MRLLHRTVVQNDSTVQRVWQDSKFRAVGVTILSAIAGISLIGVGVSAHRESPGHREVFSSNNSNLSLSAQGASGNGTANISLEPFGPTGSSFATPPTPIFATNRGHSREGDFSFDVSAISNNAPLLDATWMCLIVNNRIYVNEPLSVQESYGWSRIPQLTLGSGETATFMMTLYAGTTINTGCGGTFSSNTHEHVLDASSKYRLSETYPSGSTNPSAASLTNRAEDGTLAVTMTINALDSKDDDE